MAPARIHMRLAKAIVILPGTGLFLIPGAILWISTGGPASWALAEPEEPRFWFAILIAAPGILLAGWTTRLFVDRGDGTPAPWDPPTKLVVVGPYRHVRNPMIAGVLLMLTAESAVLRFVAPVCLGGGLLPSKYRVLLQVRRAEPRAPVRGRLPALQGERAALDTQMATMERLVSLVRTPAHDAVAIYAGQMIRASSPRSGTKKRSGTASTTRVALLV